jgi:hypothetical protein
MVAFRNDRLSHGSVGGLNIPVAISQSIIIRDLFVRTLRVFYATAHKRLSRKTDLTSLKLTRVLTLADGRKISQHSGFLTYTN